MYVNKDNKIMATLVISNFCDQNLIILIGLKRVESRPRLQTKRLENKMGM